MADSIPRSYLKEITDSLVRETLYVAFFKSDMSGYIETADSSLYSALGNEVFSVGTGYTTGGYALSSLFSEVIDSTNAVRLTASAIVRTGANWTCRYAVIYDYTTKKIRGVKDLGSDRTVESGSFTITWSQTEGVIKIVFA